MSQRAVRGRGEGFRAFLKSFGRMFIQPLVLLYFALALTMKLWMAPAIYLCLETLLITPNGLILWVVEILAGGLFLYSFVFIYRIAAERWRDQKAVRESGGLVDSARVSMPIEDRIRKFRMLWVCLLMTFVIIPTSVALTLADGFPTAVKDRGKLRWATQRERVQIMIRQMREQKIFEKGL